MMKHSGQGIEGDMGCGTILYGGHLRREPTVTSEKTYGRELWDDVGDCENTTLTQT